MATCLAGWLFHQLFKGPEQRDPRAIVLSSPSFPPLLSHRQRHPTAKPEEVNLVGGI
uniref:Uncharacterized protein n=1 Tax=Setaria italica TaxID=4555 RepID=K3ZGR1_SETIT